MCCCLCCKHPTDVIRRTHPLCGDHRSLPSSLGLFKSLLLSYFLCTSSSFPKTIPMLSTACQIGFSSSTFCFTTSTGSFFVILLSSWSFALFDLTQPFSLRTIIYPLRIRGGKPTPFTVFFLALLFCTINAYLQIRDLTYFRVYPRYVAYIRFPSSTSIKGLCNLSEQPENGCGTSGSSRGVCCSSLDGTSTIPRTRY